MSETRTLFTIEADESDAWPSRRLFLRDVGFFELGKVEEDKESIEVEELSASDKDDDDVGSLSLFDSPSSLPSLVVISTETSMDVVVAVEVVATDEAFSSTR